MMIEPVAAAIPIVMQSTTGGDLVSNLLTGGGFVFLAAVMGGLALWNKNQSESAKSIAEGSREFVEGARVEIIEARKESRELRKAIIAKEAELDKVLESVAAERRRFKAWVRQQKIANDAHNQWDEELVALLEGLGAHIREAPPLAAHFLEEDLM